MFFKCKIKEEGIPIGKLCVSTDTDEYVINPVPQGRKTYSCSFKKTGRPHEAKIMNASTMICIMIVLKVTMLIMFNLLLWQ